MDWDTSPRTVQSDGFANAGYPFTPAVRGGTPRAFGEALHAARRSPQIIIIHAWNEWTEGSYLEPDAEYGMKYLEAIQSAVGLPPESAAQLRKRVRNANDSHPLRETR